MSQPDLLQLSHRRHTLAALVTASVSEDVTQSVDLKFRKGRLAPWDTHLEVIRADELLGANLNAVKAYVHNHIALNNSSHIIPCFYIVIDEQTSNDESVLFVQQDWPAGPDETMRIMPQHTVTLFTGLLLFEEEFERCRDEDLDENNIYDPNYYDFDSLDRPGLESVVRIDKTRLELVDEEGDTQTYILRANIGQELGLGAVERTADLKRKPDGSFSNFVDFKVRPAEIGTVADGVRVWRHTDYFTWGQD